MGAKPKLKRDWVGRKVRLLRDIRTLGGKIMSAGTVMKVTRSYGGLHLKADKVCPHCGLGEEHRVKKVRERSVELLEEGA